MPRLPGFAMIELREISDSAEDLALLERFYGELYVGEFPDADERESLANMKEFLRLRAQGWYGRNNYHVVIAVEDDEPRGGAISDFLADTSCGVVEFLVTGKGARQSGLGEAMLRRTEELLAADAKAVGQELNYVVAEMNDPFAPGALDDCFDPFVRALIWDRWGYRRLDFPYLQPALSSGQRPVSHLMLIAKAHGDADREGIAPATMKAILAGYMRWAMRIEPPESRVEFAKMTAFIDTQTKVWLKPLGAYVGEEPKLPMSVTEISGVNDPDLDRVVGVYGAAFPVGPSAITAGALRDALASPRGGDVRYHLWAVRADGSRPIEGIASFFTFRGAGFGGYVALGGTLKGSGRFGLLLARIEEQMLRDRMNARGWYIECALAQQPLFEKMGFCQVDIEYRQPPLGAETDLASTPVLSLMYKDFGRQFAAPALQVTDFMTAVRATFAHVYGVSEPARSPWFAHIAAQAGGWRDGSVRFR
jgi:hypothetical protein